MSNELRTAISKDLIFDPNNLTKETIKNYLCKDATDQELTFGLEVARSCKLNPIKKEIYFIKYGNNPMSIMTGYDVYLKRASRSGKYAGMKSWTTGSVETKDLKGLVEVYVKGWEKPLLHEVDYIEYVQYKHDGSINKFWKTKPKTMIKKVAIAQGFRLAFPDELDGMPYTDAEIEEENIIDVSNDNGKSRLDNIIDAQTVNNKAETIEDKKPEPEQKKIEKPKKEKKSEVVQEVEEALKTKLDKVELNEGESLAHGFITTAPKTAQVIGPSGKPEMKFSFAMADANYGTFDKDIAQAICDIIERQDKEKTQVLLNIVYKDRIKGDKTFHDIVRFEVASV